MLRGGSELTPASSATSIRVHAGGEYRLVMRYPEGDTSEWSHANESGHIATFGMFTEVAAYRVRFVGMPRASPTSAAAVQHRANAVRVVAQEMNRGDAGDARAEPFP